MMNAAATGLAPYITRPAIANERHSASSPWRYWSLATRLKLTRFYGVFAPQLQTSRAHRAEARTQGENTRQTARASDLDQRLRRVFAMDIETCPKCGSKLRVIVLSLQTRDLGLSFKDPRGLYTEVIN